MLPRRGPWRVDQGTGGGGGGAPVTEALDAQDSGAFAAGRGCRSSRSGAQAALQHADFQGGGPQVLVGGGAGVAVASPGAGRPHPRAGRRGRAWPEGSTCRGGRPAHWGRLSPPQRHSTPLPQRTPTAGLVGRPQGGAAGPPQGPREAGRPAHTLGSERQPRPTWGRKGLPFGPHAPGPLTRQRPPARPWPSSPGTDRLTRQAEARLVQVPHGRHRDLPWAGPAGLGAAPGLGGHHHLVDRPVVEAPGHAMDLGQLRVEGAGCEGAGHPAAGGQGAPAENLAPPTVGPPRQAQELSGSLPTGIHLCARIPASLPSHLHMCTYLPPLQPAHTYTHLPPAHMCVHLPPLPPAHMRTHLPPQRPCPALQALCSG